MFRLAERLMTLENMILFISVSRSGMDRLREWYIPSARAMTGPAKTFTSLLRQVVVELERQQRSFSHLLPEGILLMQSVSELLLKFKN